MGCNNCGRSPCHCVGSPYYLNTCIQDHTLKTYEAQYKFGLCPETQWNVPLCGGSAILSVPGVVGVPTGASIWHPQFGYFKITAVDLNAGTVTITNECPIVDYQASPGTQVPACTCFTLVPLPYDAEGLGSQVCVAVSFTAPAEDAPTDITVTSTTGLQVGNILQIGSGFYYLQEIKPNNVITIVNQGEGIVPGTPVIAQDAQGNFINCIQIIDQSSCGRDAIPEGEVIACDGDNVQAPLDVTYSGDILYGVDPDTDFAAFAPLDAGVPICTELTVALAISIGDPTYTISVEDSGGFTVNDLVIIGNNTWRATVTAVPNATSLDITIVPTPGANANVPVGTRVCQIGCCEDLRTCGLQASFSYISPELYNQTIGLEPPGNYYEVTLDSGLASVTAPSDCPGATYLVEASINITAVVFAEPSAVPGTDYNFTTEIQADWSNNIGFGGRINWTGPWPNTFAMPYSTPTLPMGTLNPIWNTLDLYRDVPPTQIVISYNGSYINAVTTLAAGATATLRLNLKVLTDDQFTLGDGEIASAGVYAIGSVKSMRIS